MTATGGWIEGPLVWLGRGDEHVRRAQLLAFERIFILVIGVEYWCRGIARWNDLSSAYLGSLASATLLCLLALAQPFRRPALAGLAAIHAFVVWSEFPAAGNHAYLEVLLCALAALLDPRRESDRTLYVAAVRWLAIVIFFYSGLQKVVHGYYFRAEYFAFSLWIESFRTVFRFILPAAEYQRLTAFQGSVGDGPYFVNSALVVAISNLTYVAEMLLAPALLWTRTRRLAVVLAIALIVAIESAAREVFFGLLFVNLVLVFLESKLHAKLVAPAIAFLVSLLLVRVGWLPTVVFY